VIANFHVGEVVTSLQKASLIPGGSDALVYTTMSGGIGMLVPFTSHEVSRILAINIKYSLSWVFLQLTAIIYSCI